MSLRLITGSACVDKSAAIYAELIERARCGDSSALLVPAAPDVSRALVPLAAQAPVGLAIDTLDDFLDRLWAAHGDGRRLVSPVQRMALLAESGSTGARQSAASVLTPGFIRSLSTVVQRAAEAADGPPVPASETGAEAEIIRCAAKYADLLTASGFVERGEAHRRVAGLLKDANLPGLIAIGGFTGLTVSQEAFVVAVARFTDVLVELTYHPDVPATMSAASLVSRLKQSGAQESPTPAGRPGQPPELVRIQRRLGTVGSADVSAAGAVVLSEAWGEAAEAARIIREVQDEIAQGTTPGEIAVVYRDVAPHLRELRSALEETRIPVEFDVRIPFGLSGMGRTLLALLEFGGNGPAHSRLMDVLRSPFSPAEDHIVDGLDARCRRSRVGGLSFVQDWSRTRHPPTAEFLRLARRACRDVAGPDAERRWYRLISDMLRRARPGLASSGADALTDAAAARVFMDAVRGFGALPGQAATPQVLASALREASVTLSSANRTDCVQVMGAERVRGREYDCIIVGGLQAGEFPRRIAEDALSAPVVAHALARYGIDVAPRSGTAEERLLFYQAITRAQRRLVLSWQSHDADGHPLRPSIFLEEVLDLYRHPVEGKYFAGEPPRRVLGLDSLAEHQSAPRSERRAARAQAARPAAARGVAHERLIEARRRAARLSPQASEAVRALMAQREVFSASGIETYLQCPFRWYVQRLVQPRELDERLDTAAKGRLAHDIMRRFYEALTARTGASRVLPDALDLARSIHAEIAAEALAEIVGCTAVEAASVRATARRTWRLVEADATLLPGMSPRWHEWSFGTEDGDPPEPFGTFALAGRIDRIDADDGRLVITDYKLGTVDNHRGIAAFEDEGIVQLPLYGAVAARRLGLTIVGGIYRSVSGSKPRGFIHPDLAGPAFVKSDRSEPADIERVIEQAIQRASGAVERMRAGEIRAEPRGGSCPDYCPARAFCAEWRR